jgi:hypothetical protein
MSDLRANEAGFEGEFHCEYWMNEDDQGWARDWTILDSTHSIHYHYFEFFMCFILWSLLQGVVALVET